MERRSFLICFVLLLWENVMQGRDRVVLTRFVRGMGRGGSQSILCEASDGLKYVVKFADNPQGQNVLFNEVLGSELYSSANLPGPVCRPLVVTEQFIEQNPGCWFRTVDENLPPKPGLCLGSAFLGGPCIKLYEILPSNRYQKIRNVVDFWVAWSLDVCAKHADIRQAIFIEGIDKMSYYAVFFDHGHMFCGANGDQSRQLAGLRRLTCPKYPDPRFYAVKPPEVNRDFLKRKLRIKVDDLWAKLDIVPDEWKTPSAIQGFSECLNVLSSGTMIEDVIDGILGYFQLKSKTDENGRKFPPSVLCSGVQVV